MNKIVHFLTIAFHKPFDTSVESNRALERERRIALTAIIGVIDKIITTAIPLITVRITYNYLGVEIYGLWNAIINFFALFAFSDLGLGYGLQTKLSQASGKDNIELSNRIISNSYFVLGSVAVVLLLALLLSFPFVNWANLLNAEGSDAAKLVAPVVLIIFIPKILSIPLGLISRTQFALQEGYLSSIWGTIGAILSLLFIYFVAHFDMGPIVLIFGTALIPVCTSLLNTIFYYCFQRKEIKISFKLFDKKDCISLLTFGILFCVLSALTTIGISVDTFIVAKTCSLEDAGVFAILSKSSFVVAASLTILVQPLWGANGEAIARGDIEWVKKNTKRISSICTIITFAISLVFIIFSRLLFKLWLGQEIDFSYWCLFWIFLMQVAQAFISPYFMVLNACGEIKKQILLFLLFTPICLLVKCLLGKHFGITYVPAVGAITYILIILPGIYYITKNVLTKIHCDGK